MALAVALLCVVALLGGASRSDEIQQLAARLAAIVSLSLGLLSLDFTALRERRRVLL